MAIALATQPTPSLWGRNAKTGGALDTPQPGFIKRFHQAANRLNDGRGLSFAEKALLELLLSYDHHDPKFGGQRKGYVWPSRQILCESLKIGDRALRKHLAGLRNAGVIRDMTTEEVRRFQELDCDLRDAGRGGRGWKINGERLWGLRLIEDAEPGEVCPPVGTPPEPRFRAERNGDSGQSGTIVPPPIDKHIKAENSRITTPTPTRTHARKASPALPEAPGGGGEILSAAAAPGGPDSEVDVISLAAEQDRRELEQTLQEWEVSDPQSHKIARQVHPMTVRGALSLLKRNEALPEAYRPIHSPRAGSSMPCSNEGEKPWTTGKAAWRPPSRKPPTRTGRAS